MNEGIANRPSLQLFDVDVHHWQGKILECSDNQRLAIPSFDGIEIQQTPCNTLFNEPFSLSFSDFSFDLALSGYCFFMDPMQTHDIYLQAIKELARVAKEVRIFPLLNDQQKTSNYLGPLLLALQNDNFGVEVKSVTLLPQPNALLKVWAQECRLGL